ncbi:MAG: hypothetical protein LBD23_20055 [Oscillospiraceae bacterium]|nr:hypothetical protein [Oscillospiraceae bacterium]
MEPYTSAADRINSSSITTPISHTRLEEDCPCLRNGSGADNCEIRDFIRDDVTRGNATTAHAAWTGRVFIDRRGEFARSAFYRSSNIIVMTLSCVTNNSYQLYNDYYGTREAVNQRLIFTLLHETAHHIGARDHYCGIEDVRGGTTCNTRDCWYHVQKLTDKPEIICVMLDRINIEEAIRNGTVLFCTRCIGDEEFEGFITTHLKENSNHFRRSES